MEDGWHTTNCIQATKSNTYQSWGQGSTDLLLDADATAVEVECIAHNDDIHSTGVTSLDLSCSPLYTCYCHISLCAHPLQGICPSTMGMPHCLCLASVCLWCCCWGHWHDWFCSICRSKEKLTLICLTYYS
jgi:hypothetical protein